MQTIDFVRTEKRFILPDAEVKAFKREIAALMQPVKFSENEVTQTIYLNDDNFSVPFGISLRARKYIKEEQEQIKPNLLESYICEFKRDDLGDRQQKVKTKSVWTLEHFISWSNKKLSKCSGSVSLRPYIATQLVRHHFVHHDAPDLRLTIDENVRFGYFPDADHFNWIGHEGGARIELKVKSSDFNRGTCDKITQLLEDHGALMVISKKDQAYNLLSVHLRDPNLRVEEELKDTEIEAKFGILDPDPGSVLFAIREALLGKKIEGYNLIKKPLIQVASSISYYWSGQNKMSGYESLKTTYRGLMIRSSSKKNSRILSDHHNLNCVMVRHEEKGKWVEYTKESLAKIMNDFRAVHGETKSHGHIKKTRLAIWPQSDVSGRFYHVSVDRCLTDDKIFYQFEIEYDGRDPDRIEKGDKEKEIVSEITDLAWKISSYVNAKKKVLFPEPKPKFESLIKTPEAKA